MEENLKQNHNLIVENRKKFTLSGIKDVLSFDDETVMLDTVLGKLAIKGTGLHVKNFNTETGDLVGEGKLHAFVYTVADAENGFFSRLFR